MASNKDGISVPLKTNSTNKNDKENQIKLLDQLNELFGSTFEADIISSVAQNCKWQLNKSIDALISMTSSATIPESPNERNLIKTENPEIQPWFVEEFPSVQSKCSENHFQNLCHNECEDDHQLQVKRTNTDCNLQTHNELSQKVETASLCGLKVQYRPRGMENNSDDDADVVIEEESSEYRIDTSELEHINACQFLSTSTQCPPKNTFPKVNCISSPSPPYTPIRRILSLEKLQPEGLNQLEIDIEKGYKILILMRGVPGCGKSYLARKIITKTSGSNFDAHIFSTDDYFSATNGGVYKFDASKLQIAHDFNQNRVLNAMIDGTSPIIVDNTNTQIREMQYYATIAVKFGYIVETLEPSTPWFRNVNELDKRNQHNLSKAKICMMLKRYENNINGKRLLQMLNLRYAPDNTPPQMRKIPPLSMKPQKEHTFADFEKEMREFDVNTLDSECIENFIKGIQYYNKDKCTKKKHRHKNSELDRIKLGAIGCERKKQPTETILVEISDNVQDVPSAIQTTDSTLPLNAIDCERKTCVHDIEEWEKSSETDIQSTTDRVEDAVKSHGISQCSNDSTLPNDIQLYNKPNENKPAEVAKHKNTDNDNSDNVASALLQKDDEVLSKINEEQDQDPNSLCHQTKYDLEELIKIENSVSKEENFQNDLSNKASNSKIANSTSSNSSSSSLEKVSDVDMSQFEICNSQEETNKISIPVVDNDARDVFTDMKAGGLGSLIKYIKNSFMGNEKDKILHLEEAMSRDELKSVSNERLPSDKESGKSSPFKSSPELSSLLLTSLDAGHNTWSLSSNNGSPEEILKCDIHEAPIKPFAQDILLDISVANEEFFEAHDQIDTRITIKEDTTNIVEQLLEASSDIQHAEQLNYDTEGGMETKQHVQDMMESGHVMSTYVEKNLAVLAKCEKDIGKVTKEIVNKTVTDKNIYYPDLEKDDDAVTLKPNTENVNLITWRETPFPINDVTTQLSTIQLHADEKKTILITCEQETFTDPYDFNIAYVGGVRDYKVLEAFSRNINETGKNSPNELEMLAPTRKLMLHKGTMTNNSSIFYSDAILDLDTADLEDRSAELMERFPHLSSIFILDIYENLCNRDFNWAIEYLSNFPDGEPDFYMSDESKYFAEKTEPDCHNKMEPRNKRQRTKQLNVDKLELQRQFESKIVMNEESYSTHILRVKRWKNNQFDIPDSGEPEEFQNLMSFDSQETPMIFPITKSTTTAVETKQASRLDHPAMEEEEANEEEDSLEDENEEIMELQLGHEFIRVLESEFGGSGVQTLDGLFPVIQIRRSMAQELHALWIESMQRQLWVMQEQLDNIIAKDAEYAKSLKREEAEAVIQPEEPNLKEIMDMEMALAACLSSNNYKKVKKDLLKDLSTRVVQQTLHEMFPDYDVDILLEIYEAHNKNFEETVKVIEENSANKSTLTMADVLKKRNKLIVALQKKSSFQTSRYNQLETHDGFDEACGGDYVHEDESLSYDEAMEKARDSREEAWRQLGLRNENYQKAAEACRRKHPEIAAYYSDVAKVHIRNMEMANSAAASAFLAAQFHTAQADDTLDLHFLRVSEAVQALDIYLNNQLSQLNPGARKTIFIITGRGARSSNGQSKIKPAVTKQLYSRNIRFSEANPGMLKVFLRNK